MNENIHEKYVYICTNIPLGKNRSNILTAFVISRNTCNELRLLWYCDRFAEYRCSKEYQLRITSLVISRVTCNWIEKYLISIHVTFNSIRNIYRRIKFRKIILSIMNNKLCDDVHKI